MCEHEDESARMVARLRYKLARDARDDAADHYTDAEQGLMRATARVDEAAALLKAQGEVPADV